MKANHNCMPDFNRHKINSAGAPSNSGSVYISIATKPEFYETTDKLFSRTNGKKLASSCFLIG
jgi:hypothetical protein